MATSRTLSFVFALAVTPLEHSSVGQDGCRNAQAAVRRDYARPGLGGPNETSRQRKCGRPKGATHPDVAIGCDCGRAACPTRGHPCLQFVCAGGKKSSRLRGNNSWRDSP